EHPRKARQPRLQLLEPVAIGLSPNLHVLLRHRPRSISLLPEPGGFEGLLTVEENSDALDLAVGKVIDVPGGVLDGNATGSPGTGNGHEAQDAIWADRLQTLDGDLEVGASVDDVGEEAPDPVGAVIRATDISHRGHKADVLSAARQIAVDIPLIDRRNGPPDDLHVLLRHRLLRQRGGFEGFLKLLVEADPHDQPVADRAQPDAASLHFDSVPAPQAVRERHHHMLPGIDELVGLIPSGLPVLSELLGQPPELGEVVGTPVDADRPRQVELEIWRKVFERNVKVATVERLIASTHDLHVLLRHRLLRKPGGFEGLLVIEESPNRNRLAIPDLGHEGQGRLGLGAAFPAARAGAADCDESVSQIPDLRDLDVDLAEGVVEVSEHLADAVV